MMDAEMSPVSRLQAVSGCWQRARAQRQAFLISHPSSCHAAEYQSHRVDWEPVRPCRERFPSPEWLIQTDEARQMFIATRQERA